MATVSNSALRLPNSLMADVKDLAVSDAVSVNRFIVVAVAEKVRALRERQYFETRAARASAGDFARVLAAAGQKVVAEGDEIPAGWLDSAGARRSPECDSL
jgi:hypothetical protein